MIDLTNEIIQLQDQKQQLDLISQQLFVIDSDAVTDRSSRVYKDSALVISARIILVRDSVLTILRGIESKLKKNWIIDVTPLPDDIINELIDSDAPMNYQNTLKYALFELFETIDFDEARLTALVKDMASSQSHCFTISFISRYADIILSVIDYCKSWDTQKIKKRFRSVRNW